MNTRFRNIVVLVSTLLLSALARSSDHVRPVVSEVWARATPAGAVTAAAYFTVALASGSDRLLGVRTPIAARAEIHTVRHVDGVMQMRPVKNLEIRAGAAVTLRPGGTHVMLLGLRQPLQSGAEFPLTLRFERSGELTVRAVVRPLGADHH